MPNRKLNKATDQRDAMLRNMVTAFLWNGKLVTTESRAKEVRPIAEKLITLAVSEYKNTETVTKTKIETNDKEQTTRTEVEKVIDKPQSSTPAGRSWLTFMTFPSPGSPRKVQRISANAFVKLLIPLLRSSSVSLLQSMTV